VGGFALIRQQRYLTLIALMVVALNIVNTSGEYLFGRFVVEASIRIYGAGASSLAARQQFVGACTDGSSRTSTSLASCCSCSRSRESSSISASVARCSFTRWCVDRIPDHSQVSVDLHDGVAQGLRQQPRLLARNTAQQALWLPTSRVAKYKAKQAVDSFFKRAGDVLQAGIVFIGEHLALTVPAFATLNIVLALGWVAIVAALNPAYRAQLAAGQQMPDVDRLSAADARQQTKMRIRAQVSP